MKLLMMGTGPFAVPTFKALLDSEHELSCLITRPTKPRRGRAEPPDNPMRDAAEHAGLAVLAPESINSDEGLAVLDQHAVDLFVVCDYGQILSAQALSMARLGGINLHGSLLPRYRGAAPIHWALLNGDRVAGVTVIHMTPRLDGGPMLCQRSLEVRADEDAVQLEQRLARLGVDAVGEAIEMLAGWDGSQPIGAPQRKELVTKAPRLKKSDGRIDWNLPCQRIYNQIRALRPWPGTFSELIRPGKPPLRVIIHCAQPCEPPRPLAPGEGLGVDQGMVVGCGDGALRIARIQPSGKREMSGEAFVRGYGATLQFETAE